MKTLKFLIGAIIGLAIMLGGVSGAIDPGVAIAASPVVSALSAYSGKYKDELFSTLINGMDIANDVTVETMVKSDLKFTKLSVSDGYRPFTSTEELEGDELSYSDTVLSVQAGKRELSIDIAKYQGEWLQEKMRGSGAAKGENDIPFAEYTWNRVFAELAREINDKTAYHGFDKSDATAYNDGGGTTYTVGDYVTFAVGGVTNYYKCIANTSEGEDPTDTPAKWQKVNAEAVAPGLGYHLAALITNGDVSPVTTAAHTASNAYDNLHLVWKQVPEAYKNRGVKCYISRNTYELFVEQYENDVAKFTEKDGATVKYLPRTDGKCEIVVASWMVGSSRIIMTPKENIYMGTDLLSDMNELEVVKSTLWIMKAGIRNVIGFQFRDPEAITCNNLV